MHTSGTSFVIDGIAHGHTGAHSIHQYLRGEASSSPSAKPGLPVVQMDAGEIQDRVSRGEIQA